MGAAPSENALKRLPGVSNIAVTYATETLAFRLDEDRTRRTVVEDKIRALGYTPRPLAGVSPLRSDEAIETDDDGTGDLPWWLTRKGLLVLSTGALLAVAYAVSDIVPGAYYWAYLGAAIIGLTPIARRALAGRCHIN